MKGKSWLTRVIGALLATWMLLGFLPGVCVAAENRIWLTGKFNSPAYPGRELTYSFPYRDDYFTIPATEYQQLLAQCTLGMAVSAFRAADLELDQKDAYIRDYLAQAGFENMVSCQFDEEPRADTIATLLASQILRDQEGEFLLVAVAVSGGGYEDEWLSNFSFGDESVHDGFFQAGLTVFRRILDYVDNYGADDRFKVWMGGFSRAAAVSNMAAALALASEQVEEEDLYVYTFATPNNIQLKSGDIELNEPYDHSGIYNIAGMFDPVPSIPFSEWGYGKLGTTLYLPAQETTPDYMARRAPVAAIYREITGTEYVNSPEVNWFIQKLCQLIYDMVRTADSYRSELKVVLDEAWCSRSSVFRLLWTLCGVLSRGGKMNDMLMGEAPCADTLLSVVLYDLALEKLGLHPSSWNGLSLTVRIFYEHCPEVYVAWMMSQTDPDSLFAEDTGYRRIFLDKGIEYELRDQDGNAVEAACTASLGRTVMITIPANRNYIVRLSGGRESERIKVVEYSAGSLHYAYQLYTVEGGGAYKLTLPMEFWQTWDDGGLVRLPGEDRIAPTVQALERSQIHPSAVFELEDSGFMAAHALDILLGTVFFLLAVATLALAGVIAARSRWKKRVARRRAEIKNGGDSHK